MKALSTITLMPSTKAEQEGFIEKAKREILAGEYSTIDMYARIDLIKKTLDLIMKDADVKDSLHNELSMYNEKSFDVGNFRIEKRMRKALDYSVDREYNKLKAAVKAKELELKANKVSGDGEVIPETTTDYIAITVR